MACQGSFSEPGLAAVEVSNGVDIAVTGADGAYRLADRPGEPSSSSRAAASARPPTR